MASRHIWHVMPDYTSVSFVLWAAIQRSADAPFFARDQAWALDCNRSLHWQWWILTSGCCWRNFLTGPSKILAPLVMLEPIVCSKDPPCPGDLSKPWLVSIRHVWHPKSCPGPQIWLEHWSIHLHITDISDCIAVFSARYHHSTGGNKIVITAKLITTKWILRRPHEWLWCNHLFYEVGEYSCFNIKKIVCSYF